MILLYYYIIKLLNDYIIIRHSSASVDVVHYVVRKIVCSVGGATCVCGRHRIGCSKPLPLARTR